MKLFSGISELVTPAGTGALRGPEQGSLEIICDAAMLVQDGTITWTGPENEAPPDHRAETIDLSGRAVLPGLVDPTERTQLRLEKAQYLVDAERDDDAIELLRDACLDAPDSIEAASLLDFAARTPFSNSTISPAITPERP